MGFRITKELVRAATFAGDVFGSLGVYFTLFVACEKT